MPKNTAVGIYLSLLIFLVGFAFVWQIIWLAAVGILGSIIILVRRAFDENTEYTVTADEVKKMEGHEHT